MSGRFITLEGGEGVGKSTQIRALAVALAERGVDVVATREPGGSAGAEAIRALLVENARMRAEEERLRHELHEARVALDRSFLRPSYRVREKALRGLRRTAVGRGLHRVYRVARGRSSRSA